MNELKIKEAEKQAVRKLKAEVVRLRTLGEQEQNPRIQKMILKNLCAARFWLEVAESPIIDRSAIVRIQTRKKCRTGAIVCFVIVGIAAVILAVSLFGCIENTMRGAGQMIQGTGQLVTGVGTDVVRATDGYSKEK